jgi:hypothetical protein
LLPFLHGKLDESRAHVVSLEATLKSPIATACSRCEVVSLKNLELETTLDRIYEGNDYMRKLLGWLSAQEP